MYFSLVNQMFKVEYHKHQYFAIIMTGDKSNITCRQYKGMYIMNFI